MAEIIEIVNGRKQLGLSQWALASRINRSGTWLGLRENGYVDAKAEEIEALSNALESAAAEKLAKLQKQVGAQG